MNIRKIIKEEMGDSFDWASEIPATEPLTKGNAEIGLRVKIREDSKYYDDNQLTNPKDMFGKITALKLHALFPIIVKWDNGLTNSYHYEDLDYYEGL